MRYAVIIAGGAGTRLWPMSTRSQPKQLIPFIGGRSLLEVAANRLEGLIDPECRLICTGEAFRAPIRAALPQFSDEQILGEPVGRDTVNAVGLPAAVVARRDPDAALAVFTADHLIEPVDVFRQRVETAFRLVEEHPEALVTFGIRPTEPATGYGYVHVGDPVDGFEGTRAVLEFKEKPDEATARHYLEHGLYLWNSGMFVWRVGTLLECIRRFLPEAHAGLMKIADAWDTPDRRCVLEAVYPTLPKISVDYAIMEPASTDDQVRVVNVEMPVRWLDVGSWPAYGQTIPADAEGNHISTDKALVLDGADNLVVAEDGEHVIAAMGVRDLVIVRTGRATLICHREAAHRIKELHEAVGKKFGDDYL